MCVKFGTESIAVSEICKSKGRSRIMKNNIKDSTEIKKAIKDPEVIRNILNAQPVLR